MRMPEKLMGYITTKIIDGLNYCKENNIIHRDVKPPNILMNKNGSIKLCDFGEASILENSLATTNVGTIQYLPPERLTTFGAKYDVRTDVWSVGITLAEMILGKLPHQVAHPGADLKSHIVTVSVVPKTDLHEFVDTTILTQGYSAELCEFLKECFNELESRPKFIDLITYQFYQEHKDLKEEDIREFMEIIDLTKIGPKEKFTNSCLR